MSERPADDDPTATAQLDFQSHLQRLARSSSSGQDQLDSTPNLSADTTATDFPVIPGYRIHRKIGRGGMGVVYEATDERLKVRVALKVLPDKLDEDDGGPANRHTATRERFAAEAAILAQFEHPNIVRVYAAGEANGWLYFAMRLLPNGALNRHLAAARTGAANVAQLLAKIARAVQHLHDKDVWHRDLKPHNILIGDGGEPQVADFGVAKWADGRATVGFVRLGTYAYMAPEMIALGSAGCGPAVDVWALGVMLYELLAGERPFEGETEAELIGRVATAAPPPFSESATVCPGTDDRLEAIALRALAKDPARRYPTAAAMADDLERWLGREPGGMPSTPLIELRRNASAVGSDDATKTILAPPRRRRWRGFRWLAAGVAILAIVLTASLLHRPTLNELLEKHGEAVIVDKDGRTRFEPTLLPGCEGVPRRHPDGYLELTGSPKALFEIDTAPEGPLRIEAEVSHLWGNGPDAQIGIYIRRRAHQTAANKPPEHALFAVMLDLKPVQGQRGRVRCGGGWADPNATVLGEWFLLNEIPIGQVERHPAGPNADFRSVTIEWDANRVIVTADNLKPVTIPWGRVVGGIATALAPQGQPLPAPLLGDGFGFVVTSGSAGVRNVRITRPAQ